VDLSPARSRSRHERPKGDSAGFRLLFNEWRLFLFLFRRVLIRLKYQGKVISPHKGWSSSSDVGDFSEDHKVFTPADPELDPGTRFVRKLKEHQAGGGTAL
jgi:hypothetical protein